MNPGRELDALIAEKVMGLKNIRKDGGFAHFVEPDYVHGNHPQRNSGIPIPHYSTDIAAAWEVVEKISPIRIEKHERAVGGFIYRVSIVSEVNNWEGCGRFPAGYNWSIEKETAPHAICLAALRAVGYKEEK